MVLLWLLPPVVVTLVAMVWVSWLGREGRGEVDREEALRRMGVALDAKRPWWRRARRAPGYAVTRRAPERSTGVAVRRSVAAPPQRPAAPGQHPRRRPRPRRSDERRAS